MTPFACSGQVLLGNELDPFFLLAAAQRITDVIAAHDYFSFDNILAVLKAEFTLSPELAEFIAKQLVK